MTEPSLDEYEVPFDEVDAYEAVDRYLREDALDVVRTIARHWDNDRDTAADNMLQALAYEIDDAEISQGWLGPRAIAALIADAALDTEVGE